MAAASPASILILSGPPGAGKTTVAAAMASASPVPAVHLHTDDFFDAIKAGFIAPWLPESNAQNTVITRAIALAAGAYTQGGYRVFIDGVVGPWFLETYIETARGAGVALDYVLLRPSREIVVTRARDRVMGPLPDYPPNIYEGLSDLGALEGHVIDNGALEIPGVIAAIEAGLAQGRFRLA